MAQLAACVTFDSYFDIKLSIWDSKENLVVDLILKRCILNPGSERLIVVKSSFLIHDFYS